MAAATIKAAQICSLPASKLSHGVTTELHQRPFASTVVHQCMERSSRHTSRRLLNKASSSEVVGQRTSGFLGGAMKPLEPLFANRRPKTDPCRAAVGSSVSASPIIDVEGSSKPIKLIVLGGNGFVGTHVVQAALEKGYEVTSINRSGRPTVPEAWVYNAEWITGDVFAPGLEKRFEGASAVMTCLGGFGTNEQMERLCGDANVRAAEAAKAAGVPRFIFVSVHDYNLPSGLKDSIGYFVGKQKAEKRIRELFPETGVILRPGFIYGSRRVPQVNNISVPLTPIGVVVEKSLSILPDALTDAFGKIPGSDVVFASPVDVKDVAKAAVEAVRNESIMGVVDIKEIKRIGSQERV